MKNNGALVYAPAFTLKNIRSSIKDIDLSRIDDIAMLPTVSHLVHRDPQHIASITCLDPDIPK